jgi:HlyD family secretion protein
MNTTSRRRVTFWGAMAVIVLGGLVVALLPQPVPVDLAAARRGPLRVTLDHEGRTRVRQRYVVSAPVPGRLLRIQLEPGDRVLGGKTVLATFLPAASSLLDARSRAQAEARLRTAEAVLRQVQAERDRARAESELASSERDRTHKLRAEGLATDQSRQAADAEAAARAEALAAAESAVQAAGGEVDAARAALLEPGARRGRADAPGLSLRSPIDGVVLRRLRESEADVPQGEPLLEVADLSTLEVMADFLSADAVRIAPGMPALIEQWGGGAPLNARVRRVEPSGFLKVSALGVEEQRVWVILEFADPRAAWKALGDGYRVEARVVIWDAADALTVPVSSLFRRGQGWAVFVVQDGRAALRAVEIGHRNGTAAEITRGLQPGERVVTHPPDRLTDGAQVVQRELGTEN